MSFARFSDDCDVYVYSHVDGYVECCACGLDGECHDLRSPDEAAEHMREHDQAGHQVPEALLDAGSYEPNDFEPYVPLNLGKDGQ